MALNYETSFQTGELSRTFNASTSAIEITLPPSCTRITVGGITGNVLLGFGARTDGVLMSPTDAIEIAANAYFTMSLPHDVNICYVASVAGVVATTLIMEVK